MGHQRQTLMLRGVAEVFAIKQNIDNVSLENPGNLGAQRRKNHISATPACVSITPLWLS